MLVVFVNGKRIAADILDLDVQAGWVEVEDLSVLNTTPEEEGKPGDEVLAHNITLPRKKIYGKVTVKAFPDE